MEKKHKDLLIKNQVFLVEKLDMKKLFDHLLSTRVLTNDDKEKLERETKTGMAQEFVTSILPRRGPNAFGNFIAALKSCDQQKFIADKLLDELAQQNGSSDTTWQDDKKNKELITLKRVFLVQNLNMPELFDYVIQIKLLSSDDKEILERKTMSGMAGAFLDMLPRSGKDWFEKFIEALVSCNQEFIAEELDSDLATKYEGIANEEDSPDAARNKQSDDDIIRSMTADSAASAFQPIQAVQSAFVKQCGEDVYPMFRQVRGRAVIISNRYFDTLAHPMRKGSEVDEADLETMFKAINFHVIQHKNQSAKQIRDIIIDESKLDHSQYDAFILFVLSHGENGYIFGNDGERVNIDDQIAAVLGDCPTLRNKPKLLFFQACRVDPKQPAAAECKPIQVSDSGLQKMSDSQNKSNTSKGTADRYADFFIAYATIAGFEARRNTKTGSYFARFFVYVCSSQAHNTDVNRMMNKVNRLVKTHLKGKGLQQISETISTLSRDVYFFPQYFI